MSAQLTEREAWAKVEASLGEAKSLAFDGCHKIYVLMDDEQTEQMRGYGYGDGDGSSLLLIGDVQYPLALLRQWFYDSCGLRFINAVKTDRENANAGFTDLIGQFELEDEEDD